MPMEGSFPYEGESKMMRGVTLMCKMMVILVYLCAQCAKEKGKLLKRVE